MIKFVFLFILLSTRIDLFLFFCDPRTHGGLNLAERQQILNFKSKEVYLGDRFLNMSNLDLETMCKGQKTIKSVLYNYFICPENRAFTSGDHFLDHCCNSTFVYCCNLKDFVQRCWRVRRKRRMSIVAIVILSAILWVFVTLILFGAYKCYDNSRNVNNRIISYPVTTVYFPNTYYNPGQVQYPQLQYNQPQYGQQQYSQPQYGQQQYSQPQYGQQQYSPPQNVQQQQFKQTQDVQQKLDNQSEYGKQQQYNHPQDGQQQQFKQTQDVQQKLNNQTEYGQEQYTQPQYGQQQYSQPQNVQQQQYKQPEYGKQQQNNEAKYGQQQYGPQLQTGQSQPYPVRLLPDDSSKPPQSVDKM